MVFCDSGKRRQSADAGRLNDRRLAPALLMEAQADLFNERAAPVVAGDFVERRQTQAVRQTQVVEPARVVVGDDVVAGAMRADEMLPGGECRVAGAKALGVGTRGEEEARVQPARELAVQPLPVILEVILGEIVLHGADAVFGQAGTERVAVEHVAARQRFIRFQPGEQLDRRIVLDQMPGLRLGVRVVVPALAHVPVDPLKRRSRTDAASARARRARRRP